LCNVINKAETDPEVTNHVSENSNDVRFKKPTKATKNKIIFPILSRIKHLNVETQLLQWFANSLCSIE